MNSGVHRDCIIVSRLTHQAGEQWGTQGLYHSFQTDSPSWRTVGYTDCIVDSSRRTVGYTQTVSYFQAGKQWGTQRLHRSFKPANGGVHRDCIVVSSRRTVGYTETVHTDCIIVSSQRTVGYTQTVLVFSRFTKPANSGENRLYHGF